jgi:very-short-patch-repair endonuclease
VHGQTNRSILAPRLPRRLRHQATDAERELWQHLRGRQLGGCKFRRQHALGDYVVDFVCLERRLIVELDGGQHGDPATAVRDEQRTAFLRQAGFMVLRYWNDQVFNDMTAVLEDIWRGLGLGSENPSPPQPSP